MIVSGVSWACQHLASVIVVRHRVLVVLEGPLLFRMLWLLLPHVPSVLQGLTKKRFHSQHCTSWFACCCSPAACTPRGNNFLRVDERRVLTDNYTCMRLSGADCRGKRGHCTQGSAGGGDTRTCRCGEHPRHDAECSCAARCRRVCELCLYPTPLHIHNIMVRELHL